LDIFCVAIPDGLKSNDVSAQRLGGSVEAKDPRAMLKKVARYFQVPEIQLTGKRTGLRDERGMALELMHRYCDASQTQIGQLVGLDYTAVSRERTRLRNRIEPDRSLKRRLHEVEISVLS
jgi:chromosomal replication initiation ATPase DnaA